jgi:hypothetical protein
MDRVQLAHKAPSVKEFFEVAEGGTVTVMRQSHRCLEGPTTENSGIDAGTGDDNCELVVIVRNDTTRA